MATQESKFSRFLDEFKQKNYESEFTKFMRELKQQRPQLEAEQRKSRAIWWDKRPQDLASTKVMDEGRVPQTGYVYPDQD